MLSRDALLDGGTRVGWGISTVAKLEAGARSCMAEIGCGGKSAKLYNGEILEWKDVRVFSIIANVSSNFSHADLLFGPRRRGCD